MNLNVTDSKQSFHVNIVLDNCHMNLIATAQPVELHLINSENTIATVSFKMNVQL